MIEATRPKEVLYFFHIPVETDKGTAYIFNVMDTYSEFVISLGTSRSLNEDTVISHIKKLLKHKDFKRSPKKPFTLVCNLEEDFQQRIRAILLLEKGKLIIDANAVEHNTKAFVESFKNRA